MPGISHKSSYFVLIIGQNHYSHLERPADSHTPRPEHRIWLSWFYMAKPEFLIPCCVFVSSKSNIAGTLCPATQAAVLSSSLSLPSYPVQGGVRAALSWAGTLAVFHFTVGLLVSLSFLSFLRGVGTTGLSVTEEEKEGRMIVDGTRDSMAARSLGTDEGSLCGLSQACYRHMSARVSQWTCGTLHSSWSFPYVLLEAGSLYKMGAGLRKAD